MDPGALQGATEVLVVDGPAGMADVDQPYIGDAAGASSSP